MDVKERLALRSHLVEDGLAKYMPPLQECSDQAVKAMHYSVFSGGKRLRPILLLEAGALGGISEETLLPAACAVEMVHCYSLIHDDLPAMDNDDLRRGRPTCHKAFGEDIAILAGDALLTLAFEVMAQVSCDPHLVVRGVLELARAAGWAGMVGGQVLDIKSTGRAVSPGVLYQMHAMKTGALITASLRIGAILGRLPDHQLEALTRYGQSLGLAFQIVDDVLDVDGQEEMTGKPVGSDASKDKTTFVTVFGTAESRKLAVEECSRAVEALGALGPEADFLRELARFTATRER